ncbi:MAG: succinate dehydrogenase flavoprotein subunit [Caldilineaceae bacterium SB0670_bin_27]|uniref:Succinate dehydrogenase flavoprotein subunit n=1 Tax=Caldilineaceae bacterium SB0664_bin_27 TaxID=2605260 RepID=A0A6B0YLA5_9CHLR|nr:succinate dehydrogenase flavoprotein subunit [Caldilineaceae bacterium SB0664_bin_27]MYJ78878.1 succinate dehydrogenase flavoprotein subunit [Caldilineaceae bacterium SB0670_bin_27]
MHTHRFETVVVGAGGAGLMAALYASQGSETAVLTKLYPTRSHTGTAQGGIGAALGNLEEDRAEWHTFDTIKGSDYLADQDAVDLMCQEAVEVIYELEHMGLPFDRTPEGKIAQRPFGGHTSNFGEKPVRRACHAADRTGHMILQTLYQQCIARNVRFFDEFHVLDLLLSADGQATGVVAYEIDSGDLHVFHGKALIFATGGFGRMWEITSNAHSLTGDGPAIALHKGIPLEDMEFFQFHPTGIYKMGILITEGVRGEGGILRNRDGERFMERYAPNLKDLASRDVVSRAIYLEVRDNKGIDGARYVHLDATHLGRQVVETKLADSAEFCKTYLGIDPAVEPMPVQPTAHYAMGGIPTNVDGEVQINAQGDVMPGFYAAGEVACVSVHGANRLGTNSLVDLVVFGKRAGKAAAAYCQQNDWVELPAETWEPTQAMLQNMMGSDGQHNVADLRTEMQALMMDKVGVFRTEEGIQSALNRVRELQESAQDITVMDKGKRFNTDVLEAIELQNLLDLAEVTAASALARTESRGAHSREDHKARDDENWLTHTYASKVDGKVSLDYAPVNITIHHPEERTY